MRKALCVIVGSQRSGTTVIGRTIGLDPDASYVGEVFHNVRGPQDSPEFEKYLVRPEGNYFVFLERLYQSYPSMSYPSPENRRVLWDLFRSHLFSIGSEANWIVDVKYNSMHHLDFVWQEPFHWPGLFSILAATKTPILHVWRRDHFAQAVSLEYARKSGIWHQRMEDTPIVPSSIRLDPAWLKVAMNQMRYNVTHFRHLLSYYPRSAELIYENVFEEHGAVSDVAAATISDIFGLHGVLRRSPDLRKIMPRRLGQFIENSDEVLEFFRDDPLVELVKSHLSPDKEVTCLENAQ